MVYRRVSAPVADPHRVGLPQEWGKTRRPAAG